MRRRAPVALALALLALASCGRPPDTAWLKLLGFQDVGGNYQASVCGLIWDDYPDRTIAVLMNTAASVGTTTPAAPSINVDRVRIEYRAKNLSLPTAEYPAVAVIAPGDVAAVPVVVTSPAVKEALLERGVTASADLPVTVTFFGRTADGAEVQVAGDVDVALGRTVCPEVKLNICSDRCSKQGACSHHNGVDCSAGPDVDGSVKCVDKTVDSSVAYHCH